MTLHLAPDPAPAAAPAPEQHDARRLAVRVTGAEQLALHGPHARLARRALTLAADAVGTAEQRASAVHRLLRADATSARTGRELLAEHGAHLTGPLSRPAHTAGDALATLCADVGAHMVRVAYTR